MGPLLGGAAGPVGWFTCYVNVPLDDLADAVTSWFKSARLKKTQPLPYPDCLSLLDPLETPWTTQLLIECDGWTAYLNNGRDGGDPTNLSLNVPRTFPEAHCVVAMHTPRYGPGHGGTQFWVLGPDGEPPLMYRRTLSAVAEDGRWLWYEAGEPLPFEETERYSARLKRDRLNRDVLLRYLAALGIRADDPGFYRHGIALKHTRIPWTRHPETVDEARTGLGLSPS